MNSKRFKMITSGRDFEKKVALLSTQSVPSVALRNMKFYFPLIHRGTECDVIVITQHSIYCVECKNYNSYISGNEGDIVWFFRSSGKFGKVSNPVRANDKHIRVIRGLLRKNNADVLNIENIVCVPDGTAIYTNSSSVMHLSRFVRKLMEDSSKIPPVYNMNKVRELLESISENRR